MILAAATAAWGQDFQVGARAKGMGGSYTAFEDDPISIWLNPAGIATQATQMSIAYQTYTQYEAKFDAYNIVKAGEPETGVIEPQLLPSFQGFVFQIGTPEQPMAVGIAYIRPFHLKMTYDVDLPPNGLIDEVENQEFSRIRVAFGYDFRIKKGEETGFLTHIAVGLGLDMGFTKWGEQADVPDFASGSGGATVRNSDTATKVGFGLGVLAGLYDNAEDLKVVLGLGFQSKLDFKFTIDKSIFPVWSWPSMVNMGVTLYVLQGMPLRLTLDLQSIDWAGVLEKADPGTGRPDFRSVRNVSIGGEYKYKLREDGTLLLYPRAGFRFLQAPWEDAKNLPSYATQTLLINSKGDSFTVFTFGFGLYWMTAEGKSRGVDMGFELGGDSDNLAFGYTHEF